MKREGESPHSRGPCCMFCSPCRLLFHRGKCYSDLTSQQTVTFNLSAFFCFHQPLFIPEVLLCNRAVSQEALTLSWQRRGRTRAKQDPVPYEYHIVLLYYWIIKLLYHCSILHSLKIIMYVWFFHLPKYTFLTFLTLPVQGPAWVCWKSRDTHHLPGKEG